MQELKNTLEHAFIRCNDDAIAANHLPTEFRKLVRDDAGTVPMNQDQEARSSDAPYVKPVGANPGLPCCWASTVAPYIARCKNTASRLHDDWGILILTGKLKEDSEVLYLDPVLVVKSTYVERKCSLFCNFLSVRAFNNKIDSWNALV
jgi:hypothetical protein